MATALTSFYEYISPDVMPCPNVIIKRELLSTIIEFCEKSQILRMTFEIDLDTDLIDSTDYKSSLDISFFDHMQDDYWVTSIIECWIDGTQYILKEDDIQTTVEDWSTIISEREPYDNTKFFTWVDDTTLRMFDMQTSYDKIVFKVAYAPLRTVTEVPSRLFNHWIDEIAAGTKYRILKMPEKEWSNAKAAAEYLREYRKGLSQAKQYRSKNFTSDSSTVNYKSFGEID